MEDKKDMLREQEAASKAASVSEDTTPKADEAAVEDEDEDSLIIKLKKPYKFEGKEYTEIDLSGLEDLSAADMIAVNKYMDRTATGIQVMPEVSLEYACVFASKAAKLPVEFFTNLPPKQAIKVKNRVMGFLFGAE